MPTPGFLPFNLMDPVDKIDTPVALNVLIAIVIEMDIQLPTWVDAVDTRPVQIVVRVKILKTKTSSNLIYKIFTLQLSRKLLERS